MKGLDLTLWSGYFQSHCKTWNLGEDGLYHDSEIQASALISTEGRQSSGLIPPPIALPNLTPAIPASLRPETVLRSQIESFYSSNLPYAQDFSLLVTKSTTVSKRQLKKQKKACNRSKS